MLFEVAASACDPQMNAIQKLQKELGFAKAIVSRVLLRGLEIWEALEGAWKSSFQGLKGFKGLKMWDNELKHRI